MHREGLGTEGYNPTIMIGSKTQEKIYLTKSRELEMIIVSKVVEAVKLVRRRPI